MVKLKILTIVLLEGWLTFHSILFYVKIKLCLSGYSSIAGQQKPSMDGDSSTPLATLQDKRKRKFELPELLHNLNLLVDMTEQDIISADRKLAYHKDRIEVLQSEGEKLNILVEREKKQIEAMEEIINVLDKLEEKHNTGDLDHELAIKAFTKLKDEFSREFHEFEIGYCAQTVVIPLVKRSLGSWSNPLASRNESLPHLTTFTQWREILDMGDNSDYYSGQNPGHSFSRNFFRTFGYEKINKFNPYLFNLS